MPYLHNSYRRYRRLVSMTKVFLSLVMDVQGKVSREARYFGTKCHSGSAAIPFLPDKCSPTSLLRSA